MPTGADEAAGLLPSALGSLMPSSTDLTMASISLSLTATILVLLSNTQAVTHYTAAALCKAACGCKSLAGAGSDGEGTKALAAKSERRVAGTVLYENRRVDRLPEAG